MFYLNLSSNQIYGNINNYNFLIPNINLEATLPSKLKFIIENFPFDQIFLLNGPGSFTSLRIGCLSINLLNFFFNNKYQLYSISKIDYYKILVTRKLLPPIGIIYLGQKKNFWLYDFISNQYQIISVEQILNIHDRNNIFLDQVYEIFQADNINKQIVQISIIDQAIQIIFLQNKLLIPISDLNIIPNNQIAPNYMIPAIA